MAVFYDGHAFFYVLTILKFIFLTDIGVSLFSIFLNFLAVHFANFE